MFDLLVGLALKELMTLLLQHELSLVPEWLRLLNLQIFAQVISLL